MVETAVNFYATGRLLTCSGPFCLGSWIRFYCPSWRRGPPHMGLIKTCQYRDNGLSSVSHLHMALMLFPVFALFQAENIISEFYAASLHGLWIGNAVATKDCTWVMNCVFFPVFPPLKLLHCTANDFIATSCSIVQCTSHTQLMDVKRTNSRAVQLFCSNTCSLLGSDDGKPLFQEGSVQRGGLLI